MITRLKQLDNLTARQLENNLPPIYRYEFSAKYRFPMDKYSLLPEQLLYEGFYLSGVDILASDKLGRLTVSLAGCRERGRFVFQYCKDRGLPVAVSMGRAPGYHH